MSFRPLTFPTRRLTQGWEGERVRRKFPFLKWQGGSLRVCSCRAFATRSFPFCIPRAALKSAACRFAPTRSLCLCDCDSAVLFVATVGGAPDRLMAKYSHVSPAASLAVSAVGSERVEALCDLFCAELAAENATRGRVTVQRFSPGYGDLPLSVQRDIFSVLAPHKHIGVMLGDSLLMSPSKSVSAIVGIKPRKDSL